MLEDGVIIKVQGLAKRRRDYSSVIAGDGLAVTVYLPLTLTYLLVQVVKRHLAIVSVRSLSEKQGSLERIGEQIINQDSVNTFALAIDDRSLQVSIKVYAGENEL